MKVAVYGDGVFKGYKADTFWNLSMTHAKEHNELHEGMISNLLCKLTRTPQSKDGVTNILDAMLLLSKNDLVDCQQVVVKLVDKNDKVLRTVVLTKTSESLWEVKS